MFRVSQTKHHNVPIWKDRFCICKKLGSWTFGGKKKKLDDQIKDMRTAILGQTKMPSSPASCLLQWQAANMLEEWTA